MATSGVGYLSFRRGRRRLGACLPAVGPLRWGIRPTLSPKLLLNHLEASPCRSLLGASSAFRSQLKCHPHRGAVPSHPTVHCHPHSSLLHCPVSFLSEPSLFLNLSSHQSVCLLTVVSHTGPAAPAGRGRVPQGGAQQMGFE